MEDRSSCPKAQNQKFGDQTPIKDPNTPSSLPPVHSTSHFYPRRSSFLSWTLQYFSRCSECGTEMAILWLGPSASRVTLAVDQTPSSPTPTPGNTVLASALAPSGQRQVEPTHSINGLGKARPTLISRTPSHPAATRGHLRFAGPCAERRSPEPQRPAGAARTGRPGAAGAAGLAEWPGNAPGRGQEGPLWSLETSGRLPAELRSWKGSATARRGTREQRGFAIKTPARLSVI